jgi:methionyl aminopeptidase
MTIRSRGELDGLREVGLVVRETLDALEALLRAGITTGELDSAAGALFRRRGARSAPRLVYSFPGTVCISVNDEIVHGVPGSRRLKAGDLVKLDVTAEKDGFVADAARTVVVPPAMGGEARMAAAPGSEDVATDVGRLLVQCAQEAFAEAMAVLRAGARVRDIGRAVETTVGRRGFAVVRELSGHGVGRSIHEEPTVPNFYQHESRIRLHEGLVLAIEPIISAGSGAAFMAPDGWTVRTADGALAAHYAHTVVVTEGAPTVVTAA